MKYLLDTDICIFFLQGKFHLDKKINSIGVDSCAISEITLAELRYGAAKSSNFEKHTLEVDAIERIFTTIPIYGCIRLSATERARLNRLGKSIPDFDLLIGTTAVCDNRIIVTNNSRHFERIEGSVLENWSLKANNQFLVE